VAGDVVNFEAVEKAIVGQDAILSALGSPTLKKNRVLSDGTKNIISAMEKHGVKRFVCETALGVGESKNQPGFVFNSFVVPFLLRNVFADKEIQERDIKRSNLEWIIVRPGGLTNGAKTGNYRYGLNRSIKGRIARADVADFMLRQLKNDEFLRQTPAIAL
jgi:putative NADH-flavin reductase